MSKEKSQRQQSRQAAVQKPSVQKSSEDSSSAQTDTPLSGQHKPAARASEKTGILRFFREMGAALGMALVAIVYVIQAFQIPTGSMEKSLLVGDFLLGLKFIYGAPIVPFSQELGVKRRMPAITDPKRGDIIIFKYPGTDKKDYIKRMVAGPGDVIEIKEGRVPAVNEAGDTVITGDTLIINGMTVKLPPKGQYTSGVNPHPGIANFAPLYIPAKGDTLRPDTMAAREFLFFKILVHQENPTDSVRMRFDLYLDGEPANNTPFNLNFNGAAMSMHSLQNGGLLFRNENTRRTEAFDFNKLDDWTLLTRVLETIRANFPERKVEIRQTLFLNEERVEKYTVQFDNYFMMGDNRDNSLDSRYWGYLNRNFVKAKAFILYFSLDPDVPLWKLPLAIRWDRIGKLIRDWDGIEEPKAGIKY